MFFVLIGIIVYRFGAYIPVPGIDTSKLATFFQSENNTVLGLFNVFSGGALSRLTIFALGIMPYISASIIIQLLSAVVPRLTELKKEGAAGQRKITQYTRYGTLFLAFFQSMGMAKYLVNQGLAYSDSLSFYFVAIITLSTGTLFLMWLGEQITERGIGNGISLIIFSSIISGIPTGLAHTFDQAHDGNLSLIALLMIMFVIVAVTVFVVFMERAQRKILVNYAKRQQGNKLYAAQSSHLPFKINMSGVIPPIFASSILLFPSSISQWFGSSPHFHWLAEIGLMLAPGQPLYIVFYTVAVVFFCFFYTAVIFNPRETADNLKKSGAFIPGIRPGEQTASYIDKVLSRLTLVGAIYITLVSLLPMFLMIEWNVPFYFGGTSLLIVVVVMMDFMAQVQSQLMSNQYESLLKKANLKGTARNGLMS
ncbi:MAG: preprotein translocase subunit SecY [Gammaproteobacteria bacterium]|nr:preprotein translocase subunit SecY [Gammaproteobacteria bacterium]